MRRIVIFAEDYGHEEFLKALIQRLAEEHHVEVEIEARSVRGGHGKVITELREFFRDLHGVPDLLVIATDANCNGYNERRREIEAVAERFNILLVCAIPDPHIERWLLLDSKAFKDILGKGCNAPDSKCSRDRYKQMLFQQV